MSTIEDYPVSTPPESTAHHKGPEGLKALLGSAALGAFIMPLSCVELTPPELTSQYVEKVLPAEAGLGLGLGTIVGATLLLASIFKKTPQTK